MAERKARAGATAQGSNDETPSKAELQRQMEEARDSITETVAEIRDTVSNQYESAMETFETVKDTVTEVLDWREKFKENPIVWGAGAISVGILIGVGLAHSFEDKPSGRRRRKHSEVSGLVQLLLGRISHVGDAVLPVVSGQIKEMFGIDLSEYLHQPTETKKRAPRKKKSTVKKINASIKGTTKKRANKNRSAE